MLQCRRNNIGPQEANDLLNWLRSPQAVSFRNLLSAEVAAQQVAAINAAVDKEEFPNREIDRADALRIIQELRACLKVMEDYTKHPEKLAFVEIEPKTYA